MEELIGFIRESLSQIDEPRFYETERGFQGALLANLSRRVHELQIEGWIVEQEYQKTMPHHGLTIRPDIIIHQPFDVRHTSRKDGNFIAIELKLNGGIKKVLEDYENLARMCEVLEYPKGVFININSSRTHLDQYHGMHKEKFHAFAVRLIDGKVNLVEDQI